MNRLAYIYISMIVVTLFGCNGRKITSQLEAVSKIADANPDSALIVLDEYSKQKDDWGKADRMHYELIRLKALNKSGVKIKSDSIIKDVVTYFDGNGEHNEQMLAYYLLGRFYANIGEAPQALQTYYDAIDKADTLDSNCDYGTLAAIYGQMASIFHQQYLPHDEIWAVRHYVKCIGQLGNEIEYTIAQSQLMKPYYLLGENDSVLQIIQNSYKRLTELGETKRAAGLLPTAIYINIERNLLSEAEKEITVFEHESGLFDDKGNIAGGREHYYATKGFYELANNDFDSAEIYFRKSIQFGHFSDAYKGLLSVYRHKNVLDSIIHFSLLYEDAQDSLHNQMQIDATHRMSSLYNYSRSQKVAEQEAQKARNARLWIIGILISVVFGGILIFYIYRDYKRKRQDEIEKLAISLNSAKKEYQDIQEELQRLKDRDYKKLIAEKELKGKELKMTIEELADATGLPSVIDNLSDFENSKIVGVFRKKKDFRSDNPIPNKAEWRALEVQFSKDMPSAYKILAKDKKLSPLELHVCMLLILDFEDSSIVNMTDSISQTITTAKSRANRKIFNEKSAQTLKAGLLQLIKAN
ncbi:hypothetical protein [Prevotella sp. E2-28]|uniref:hypothetical protein n=1 Tax=Prevotella sp. E2-28 TaxID=2913620 RepID=UPI001EDB00CE|nr:hypothetical protein [Prevotella sp. E2-28]UKK52538.1 hypothetical protein L6465_07910 [Prevotella sp. E2-28]